MKNETLKKIVTNNAFQITLSVIGLATALISMFIALTLSPLYESDRAISKVNAQQDKDIEYLKGIAVDFIAVKADVAEIKRFLHEDLKAEFKEYNEKMDRILLK